MSYLIAGYNTATDEEKQKYDEKKLVKYIGNMLMISAGILFLGVIVSLIIGKHEETINLIAWIPFTVFIIAAVIYINVSGHVKR